MKYEETSPDEVYIYRWEDNARYVRGKDSKKEPIKTLTLDFEPTKNDFAFTGIFEPITDPVINNKVKNLLGIPIKKSNFFII